MVYTVLVVDDSSFFQQRLKDIINEHPELKVIGIASNGQEAIEMADELQPDVISMDYEMPLLDGVSALKAILAKRRVPILMFSSLTYEGARITLDALEAGAVDFISKNFSEISKNSTRLKNQLHTALLTFAKQYKSQALNAASRLETLRETENNVDGKPLVHSKAPSNTFSTKASVINQTQSASPSAPIKCVSQKKTSLLFRPRASKILIIGASTGGPVAVHQVLDMLPANFSLPIVVVQHMPPNFTRALAERLNRVCALEVREAQSGDQIKPGLVLVAPGGKQLVFDVKCKGQVKILDGDERMSYKPSVDIAFVSAANIFERQLLGVVLTGMGSDGCEGAKILKQKGGILWSQDQASCVVYGMPKAVVDAGLSDHVLPPSEMGAALNRES